MLSMKTTLTLSATLITALFVPLWDITPTAASPAPIRESVKRQETPGLGQAIVCSLGDQCTLLRVPYDYSYQCTDFTGDFAFLNDQLKNVTLNDMACVAYGDFGCAGTNYGGDYSNPWDGPLLIDYTNLKGNGSDFSGFISSLKCTFI
ncbi:hypothetical protein D9756_002779 [Leucocoprinus leucothites]|uniref:Uncharacterized protein n=1 Tax=Leucocoprinus leucothites TaxID=201217 RepID=A0A8H5GCI0_9AGAR|nr:hypothetical protein D9756_002779 [Leucoagaricus leucothites]